VDSAGWLGFVRVVGLGVPIVGTNAGWDVNGTTILGPSSRFAPATGYLRLHGALLMRLAQVLQTTPTRISARATVAAEEFPVIDRRFLRRLKRVDKPSRHQKRLLLGTIDAFLSKVS